VLPRSAFGAACRAAIRAASRGARFFRKGAEFAVLLLRRHPAFTEAVALGSISAALLRLIPVLGPWLAPYVAGTAVITGLALEVRRSCSRRKPINPTEDP